MPPKKGPVKKDEKVTTSNKIISLRQIEDLSDPVPKNECIFKINFEIKHEAGHYFKLKYDWISTGLTG